MRLLRGLLLFVLAAVGLTAQEASPKGLKVLTAGHSFHVWMPPLVAEMAKACPVYAYGFEAQNVEALDANWRTRAGCARHAGRLFE